MPGFLIPIAVGVGTGIINAIGNADARSDREEQIRAYMARLEDMKYTSFEKEERLDTIGDYYNTNILQTQNSTAVGIGMSGVVNPEIMNLALNSQLLGQRSTALLTESSRIDEFNLGIEGQQAAAEAEMPTGSPTMDFLSGGLEGVGLGLQVENALATTDLMEKQGNALDNYFGESETTFKPLYIPSVFNQKDDSLYNLKPINFNFN